MYQQPDDMKSEAPALKEIIKAFVDGKLSVVEFERDYMEEYKEALFLSHEEYQILETFFGWVDAYRPDCPPEEESKDQITEATLRRHAVTALAKLDAILLRRQCAAVSLFR